MPDFSTIQGGPIVVSVAGANSRGTGITPNATAHTKGSWTELISAAQNLHGAAWVMVTFGETTVAAATYFVDIGIGAAASEQVIIPNLYQQYAATIQPGTKSYLLPLSIPAGVRVAARCQTNATSGNVVFTQIHLISATMMSSVGAGQVEACGAVTATTLGTSIDPGGTANTDATPWVQLIASTGFSYRWLCVEAGNATDLAYGATFGSLLDIGTGAASSEVSIIDDLYMISSSGVDAPLGAHWSFPVNIPQGSRISARHRTSSITAGDRVLEVIAWGCG
jgi:hypothetical protein